MYVGMWEFAVRWTNSMGQMVARATSVLPEQFQPPALPESTRGRVSSSPRTMEGYAHHDMHSLDGANIPSCHPLQGDRKSLRMG